MTAPRTISPQTARRLAISRQWLDGSRSTPVNNVTTEAEADRIFDVVRQIGCLQLDPISAVARSHLLVTFSRLGKFDSAALDHLLFTDRRLFEYWAHQASIVLTEDYPIHQHMMDQYKSGEGSWGTRIGEFLSNNAALHQRILSEMKANGPVLSRQFEDDARDNWQSTGWTSGRNVSRMLDFMWVRGEIMVAGRKGGQKLWDLSERCLPDWTPRDVLDDYTSVQRSAQKSLRALGVGTIKQIKAHYTRGRYPDLPKVLKDLTAARQIIEVKVSDGDKAWPGVWYLHADDLPLVEQIEAGDWQPRTVLLSPFDNLICDRDRTELMWDFYYRIEIYVPKEKRQYGYYVLPILHGDQLIGRIDSQYDRKSKTYNIHNVYAQPDAPSDAGKAIAGAVRDLGDFLGAKKIAYSKQVPKAWKTALK